MDELVCGNCSSDKHLWCQEMPLKEPHYVRGVEEYGVIYTCSKCGGFNDFNVSRICNSCEKITHDHCNCCGQVLPKVFGCDNHKMEKISDLRNGNGLGRKITWYCKSCKSSVKII